MIFSHNKSGTVLSAMYYEPHPCSIDMEDHSELDAAGTSVVGARPVDPHRPPVQGIYMFITRDFEPKTRNYSIQKVAFYLLSLWNVPELLLGRYIYHS